MYSRTYQTSEMENLRCLNMPPYVVTATRFVEKSVGSKSVRNLLESLKGMPQVVVALIQSNCDVVPRLTILLHCHFAPFC